MCLHLIQFQCFYIYHRFIYYLCTTYTRLSFFPCKLSGNLSLKLCNPLIKIINDIPFLKTGGAHRVTFDLDDNEEDPEEAMESEYNSQLFFYCNGLLLNNVT